MIKAFRVRSALSPKTLFEVQVDIDIQEDSEVIKQKINEQVFRHLVIELKEDV